jgi:hypothetical protein
MKAGLGSEAALLAHRRRLIEIRERGGFTLKAAKLRGLNKGSLTQGQLQNAAEQARAISANGKAIIRGEQSLEGQDKFTGLTRDEVFGQGFKSLPKIVTKKIQEGAFTNVDDLVRVMNQLEDVIKNDSSALTNIAKDWMPGTGLHNASIAASSQGARIARELGHIGRLSDKDILQSMGAMFNPSRTGKQILETIKSFRNTIRNNMWNGALGTMSDAQRIIILQNYRGDPEFFSPRVSIGKVNGPEIINKEGVWTKWNPQTGSYDINIISQEEVQSYLGR